MLLLCIMHHNGIELVKVSACRLMRCSQAWQVICLRPAVNVVYCKYKAGNVAGMMHQAAHALKVLHT